MIPGPLVEVTPKAEPLATLELELRHAYTVKEILDSGFKISLISLRWYGPEQRSWVQVQNIVNLITIESFMLDITNILAHGKPWTSPAHITAAYTFQHNLSF